MAEILEYQLVQDYLNLYISKSLNGPRKYEGLLRILANYTGEKVDLESNSWKVIKRSFDRVVNKIKNNKKKPGRSIFHDFSAVKMFCSPKMFSDLFISHPDQG